MLSGSLLERVRARLVDTSRPPTHLGVVGDVARPAATTGEPADAEARLGHTLPAPLRALLAISDGGFGPGYGLFGVAHRDPLLSRDLVSAQAEVAREPWWPTHHVIVLEWGCGGFGAIDASAADPPALFVDVEAARRGASFQRVHRGSLGELFSAWLDDVDLYAEMLV